MISNSSYLRLTRVLITAKSLRWFGGIQRCFSAKARVLDPKPNIEENPKRSSLIGLLKVHISTDFRCPNIVALIQSHVYICIRTFYKWTHFLGLFYCMLIAKGHKDQNPRTQFCTKHKSAFLCLYKSRGVCLGVCLQGTALKWDTYSVDENSTK